jgi:alpha-aminoadipic semialdehyde synthase
MTRAGLMIMAVDNLPAEMAREASQYFGNALYPFVAQLVRRVGSGAGSLVSRYSHRRGPQAKAPGGTATLPPTLQQAVIAEDGHVAPAFAAAVAPSLARARAAAAASTGATVRDHGRRRVLLMGAGMVAGPLVDYLAAKPHTQMTIGTLPFPGTSSSAHAHSAGGGPASLVEKEAHKLVRGRSNVRGIGLDIQDKARVTQLVGQHDLVVRCVRPYGRAASTRRRRTERLL